MVKPYALQVHGANIIPAKLADVRVVHLLLIDAEGHDHEVLSHYPFESLPTWRVVFEAARVITASGICWR